MDCNFKYIKMKISFALCFVIVLSGCGLSIPVDNTSTQTYICQTSSNSFASCCGGQGGPQNCSPPSGGHFFRNSDGALVCTDGSVSGSCFR
ncbi:hypothetical protein K2P97_09275 [bacterium]|nr:hypothetical protein [bacterium]